MNATMSTAGCIIVAFDPWSPDVGALRLALQLGAGGAQALHALYVEELDALTLGAFPWVREVAIATARAQPIMAGVIEREYQQRAAAARTAFETLTAGMAGAHFERVRGKLREELQRLAGDASAVLLEWPPAARRSRAWAQSMIRTLLSLPAPLLALVAARPVAPGILVVAGGEKPGIRQLALRLAAASGARVASVQGRITAARVIERARLESAGLLLVGRDAGEEFIGELALRWSGSLVLMH